MNLIKAGDVSELHVHSIDRLGRNTIDILTTIKLITSYGCNVISEKEGLRMMIEGSLTQ
jgi:DNA invertase Pin-like site-specific DNA recombinase